MFPFDDVIMPQLFFFPFQIFAGHRENSPNDQNFTNGIFECTSTEKFSLKFHFSFWLEVQMKLSQFVTSNGLQLVPRYWPFVRGIHRTGEFPTQRPETQSFDVFFDQCLNKRLSKQWWRWWFKTPSRSLWRHCNGSLYLRHNNIQQNANHVHIYHYTDVMVEIYSISYVCSMAK